VSALELTLEFLWRGIHLEVVGAKIRYEAPPGALDRELKEVGRRHMAEMVDLLSHPGKLLRAAWGKAVEEVAAAWNDHQARHGDAPWLPEEENDAFHLEVAGAMRREDVEATLDVITRWRRRWTELLRDDGPCQG
jgi:hypothetical protein